MANSIIIKKVAIYYNNHDTRVEDRPMPGPMAIPFNPAISLPVLAFPKPYLDRILISPSTLEFPDIPFGLDTLQKIMLGRKNQNSDGIERVIDGKINLSNIQEVIDAYPYMITIGRAIFKHNSTFDNLFNVRKPIGK